MYDLNTLVISTTLECTDNFITFRHIGNSDTLTVLMICTISTNLILMLYEGNDIPSFYFAKIKIKLKQYLPSTS